MIKPISAPTTVLALCLALGGCTSFAGAVADHWPTWAGGMPNDVPPRPGAPGYEEFIAHQNGKEAAAASAAAATSGGTTPPPAVTPVAATMPPAPPTVGSVNTPPMPPAYRRIEDDQSAVHGGLY
jgi:hypothetical protein